MVSITLYIDSAGRLDGLTCSGHAEFSDDEHGGDIVCAAVSALTGFLGVTVTEVMGWPSSVEGDDGHFSFHRPSVGDEADRHLALDLLLDGWVRSVRGLEENYFGWVRVEEILL